MDLVARYAKAEALLPRNLVKLVDSAQARPVWVGDTDRFWYATTVDGRTDFVLVDPAAGTKEPAFDHERMAEALNTVLEVPVSAGELPILGLTFEDDSVVVVAGASG